MKTKLLYLVITFGFSLLNFGYAQQGKVDVTFNTSDDGLLGDGFDSNVRSVSLQNDGKLIVVGDFLNFNGSATPHLCRLFSDGSKDISLAAGSGFNGNVYSSLLLPDGRIILGGAFTSYDGSAVGRLIRLNSDGSRDATFNTLIGATPGVVYALALQPDGSVIIAGSFTKYNGVTANKIARILPNGDLDPSFISAGAANGVINAVQIQPDGKIIVAGTFTVFNGTTCNRIVRLNTNGSIDTTFSIGTGFDDEVRTLAVQSDGKILAGGDFITYNGAVANRIIRLNSGGSLDSSFTSGSGFNNGYVSVIKTTASGEIMAAGSFSTAYNGSNVNRLVLLDGNGVINPAFDIGSGPASASVFALANSTDGSWYVGGSFSVFDSQNQGRLAKIDATGVLDIGYLTSGVGFDNSVFKVISLSGNKMMVFGSFTKFNGTSASRMARLLDVGTVDVSFNSSGVGANNSIKSAVIQTDAKIIFAGAFTSYNGITANRIARVLPDGNIDPTFSTGAGFNNQVYAVALQPDGKIIVGGNFTSYNGTAIDRIARLLPNGTIDISFNVGSGTDAIVEAVVVQPDGKILLGGRFTTYNGISYKRLVRLNADGSVDSGFSVGVGFDKLVYAIAIQSDGKLIVGGTFLSYGSASAKRIVRLNVNGSIDPSFVSGTGFSNGEVRAILVQPDNRLLLGGTFSGSYNGTAVKRMVRLLATGAYDPTFLVNLNNTLYSICFTPNNKVMIGGNFNSVSGITKHRIARIILCTNSTIWDGVGWSNGFSSAEKTIVFNGNFPSLTSVNACSCVISAGNTVTVPNGNTLGLIFDYSGLGTLVLENNASLYQTEDQITNTGIISLKRKTTPIFKTDYTYWSSAVSNQRLIDVSPNTLSDKFYSFDATANFWRGETPTNIMGAGKGYIIRGPESFSTTVLASYEAVFGGIPNNGIVSIPIAATGVSNLIGNPYPSALDADLFLTANNTVLDGTIYFWTHNTSIALASTISNPGSGTYAYTSDDYASYNGTGGVATRAAISDPIKSTSNPNIPTGKIASGQAFFTTSIGAGIVIFNNGMRLGGSSNTQFFKMDTKGKTTGSIEKNRFWVNLTNIQGAFKQTLVGYVTGATNDFDRAYDGETFNGNTYIDFYSINQSKNLVIQGRALPFNKTDVVPLGYKTTIAGDFKINIDQTDGFFVDKKIYLEDKLLGKTQDLSKAPYAFSTAVGTFNDRFVLRYTNKTSVKVDIKGFGNEVVIFKDKKELKIKSEIENIQGVAIFDLLGRKVFEKDAINNLEFHIPIGLLLDQLRIVKVSLTNGEVISKKVVF